MSDALCRRLRPTRGATARNFISVQTLVIAMALGASAVGCSDDDEPAARAASGGSGGSSGGSGGGSGGTAGDGSGGASGGTGGTAGAGGAAGGEQFDGQMVFRFDTFGDEAHWTENLRMHEVIPGIVGDGVSPQTALAVGLKVDASVLPEGILGMVDLTDPATTVALLELNAVVGVIGTVEDGVLTSVGITCALCHSDVDDSVMEGIGARLDGHANRDLNPGAILALSPFFTEEQKTALNSWGAGRYDPRFTIDGISDPVMIPPIYGLQGVELETYTGDGPISYWNAYVGITQMGGQGVFEDERIGVAVERLPDIVTPKLPALLEYQLTLMPPAPPDGTFDAEAAGRGEALFNDKAGCATCHSGDAFTDAPTLHDPEDVGQDPAYAARSATKQYRSTPLRGLWHRGDFFHDGSAAMLLDVVNHYDTLQTLGLTETEKTDLVEYLKSL